MKEKIIGRLLLLLAGAVFVCFILVPALTGTIWDGRSSLCIRVKVTDKKTGQPVSKAELRWEKIGTEISFLPERQWRPGEVQLTAKTDANGSARLDVKVRASGKSNAFRETGYLELIDEALRVNASGYESIAIPGDKLHNDWGSGVADQAN